ncbi:sigma-70 family RNA polymerase sigma factor [Virgibacillus sp. AGTR]|uniref:Sigma-70 family RNA polymerase sigma factor n=2 Tax=Bacillaceae TaxID=186817 RepID=A0A941DWY0_9BACI|nr:sigma-70 family RNA polymerase sigma factor [Virgibacillus salarius]MCC2252694.1 sigma-70 family RNA polymerase sigma factor [Virgibacillus sp. AGTR]NAZ07713.1 sigma-70 family RNA polymerase sigma factor [Agaribacter marinus]MBR7794993.1 sigma-70 family RNA polymerase sigma factor [Virgibacillus salarius]QRZ20051.1 sigma-70 family RNA polymerase sigma factor [Virgibacillus sp. AGTR]WBX82214.1 sigma-70 family RNA polymerase sigma factor [Virgibacillus salarius]
MMEREKERVLEEVMIMYGDELVRLAFHYVKNVETAKDIVQSTFIKCYQHLDSFRYKSSLKTWLYRITINGCKDYLKSWHHRKVQAVQLIQDVAGAIFSSVEDNVIQKEAKEELQQVVYTLPTIYREVIYLYYYQSFQIEEIADMMELNTSTVKTRLKRARQRLKTKLEVNYHG